MKQIFFVYLLGLSIITHCLAQKKTNTINESNISFCEQKEIIKSKFQGQSIDFFLKDVNFNQFKKKGISFIGYEKDKTLEIHFFWFLYKNKNIIKIYPEFNTDSILLKRQKIFLPKSFKQFYPCKIRKVEIIENCEVHQQNSVQNTKEVSRLFSDTLKNLSNHYIGLTLQDLLSDKQFKRYISKTVNMLSGGVGSLIIIHYNTYLTVEIKLKVEYKNSRYNSIYSRNIWAWDIESLTDYKIESLTINTSP